MVKKSEVASLVSESQKKQYSKRVKSENLSTFAEMIEETTKIVNSNSVEGEELKDAEFILEDMFNQMGIE